MKKKPMKTKFFFITIALLFSTPVWAVTPGCKFEIGKWKVSEIKDSIKLNDCEHVIFKTDRELSRITEICRFDREIVYVGNKEIFKLGSVLCVPKK